MLTDRVRAIGAVWLGLTTGCAQCHDHKFDPFTTRDFYSLGAFFADIEEPIIGTREDGMLVVDAGAGGTAGEARCADRGGEQEARRGPDDSGRRTSLPKNVSTCRNSQPDSTASDADKKAARRIVAGIVKKEASATRCRRKAGGADVLPHESDDDRRAGTRSVGEGGSRTQAVLRFAAESAGLDERAEKRTVRILPRGNWMDESGEVVHAALPHFLPQPKIEGRELTRLDLAEWLVSRENPLTARAVMNRLVEAILRHRAEPSAGRSRRSGRAAGESGAARLAGLRVHGQRLGHEAHGAHRSSPAKRIGRFRPRRDELVAADPANRELARQSRFRLDAELVRDNALSIAGLLSPKNRRAEREALSAGRSIGRI